MSGRRRRGVRLAGCTNAGAHRPVIVRINDHYVKSAGMVFITPPRIDPEALAEEYGGEYDGTLGTPVMSETERAQGSLFAWQCTDPDCGRSYWLRTQTLSVLLGVRIGCGMRTNWLDLSEINAYEYPPWQAEAERNAKYRALFLPPFAFHA